MTVLRVGLFYETIEYVNNTLYTILVAPSVFGKYDPHNIEKSYKIQ